MKNKAFFLITLAALSAFGPFVTDMYLPALPILPEAFSTTAFWVQMSMSVCMFGLAFGQIFIGPLSDKFGRRVPLLASMWLFVAASAGCVFASDIYFFVAMRFLQGVAGAGGIVLSRSIPSDNYSGMELARFLALLAAVHSIAPVAAPVVGGATLTIFSWRTIFAILLALGVALLWASSCVGESLAPERRSKLRATELFGLYKNVFADKVALSYILQQGAMSGILFAYISASPFLFQNVYGLSPMAFSAVFALNAVGIGVGSALSAKVGQRRTAVVAGGTGILCAAVAEGALVFSGAGVVFVETMLWIMMFMFGLAAPSAAAIVLDSQRENAGTAAALLGALPFLLGGLAAPCVGLGGIDVSFPAIIIFCGIFAAALSLIARNYQIKFGPNTRAQD